MAFKRMQYALIGSLIRNIFHFDFIKLESIYRHFKKLEKFT